MDTIKVRCALGYALPSANASAALQQFSRNRYAASDEHGKALTNIVPGVSLRQMVQFGERPSTGTLFRASQFLSEELPIRLAHRVQELSDLPDGLNEMPSIQRVRDWYAQSFEVGRMLLLCEAF